MVTSRLGRHRRAARRWLPQLVVIAVISVLVVSAFAYNSGPKEAFAFGINWPAPSSYAAGDTPPNVFLQINYTGQGTGSFTYIISYNSTGGTVIAAQGPVLVSHLSPFTAFVVIPAPSGGNVIATAKVYAGSHTSNDLLFSKSLTL